MRIHAFEIRLAAVLAVTLASVTDQMSAQGAATTQARVRLDVNQALASRTISGFSAAKVSLERVRSSCALSASPRDCRVLVDYSLGYLYQTEGTNNGAARDTLLARAVTYYDSALAADPGNRGALYNKALSYRAMGARAPQEYFLRAAADRDPAHRSTYLDLLGDFYWDEARWRDAVGAYRGAHDSDPDNAATRASLIQCYRVWHSPAVLPDLMSLADGWAPRFPESAADAYRVLIEQALSIPDTASGGQLAERAIVKLVAVQDRFGDTLIQRNPKDTSRLNRWAPLAQLESFLRSASIESAPWWVTSDRKQALARAARRRGSEVSAAGDEVRAEKLWLAGARIATVRSAELVDLERELALLYTRRPDMDRNGSKFRDVEDRIFIEKGAALVSGDLEAAQRFHTTLALIYAQRGTWRSPIPARNALDQLTWAIRAADQRARAEQFYQPLPELRERLATVLDSMKQQPAAARATAMDAVRAWLDADDPESAAKSALLARGMGASGAELSELERLIALRRQIADSTKVAACDARGLALAFAGMKPADFVARQRFKVFADCATRLDEAPALTLGNAAFAIVDSGGVTLVGIEDVRRLEGVASRLLAAVGAPGFHTGHLEPERSGNDRIPVSLPTETTPRWLEIQPNDRLALRAVGVLGTAARGARVRADAGVIEVAPGATPVSDATLGRLRALPGVKQVTIVRPGG